MSNNPSFSKMNREHLVESIYRGVFSNEHENKIPISEFKRYEILFSSEARRKYLENEMTDEELSEITELSHEFITRVNRNKPIHIVDDYTGEDICPPLPPLYMRTNFLYGRGTDAMTLFVNSHTNDDNIPNALSAIQKKKATMNLMAVLGSAQSAEELTAAVVESEKLKQEFTNAVFQNNSPDTDNPDTQKDAPLKTDDGIGMPDQGLDFF